MTRREFIGRALAAGGLACLARSAAARWPEERGAAALSRASPGGRKVLLVQFGGGTRFSESIGDPQHRYIPCLWNELAPAGTLFSNMRVEGKIVHPNSTCSLLTGHWEWDDLDWSKPVAHPTVFETYRRASGANDRKAWAFVYASILANVGQSTAAGFGAAFGANVVVPPTIPRSTAEEMDRLMRTAAATGSEKAGQEAIRTCAELARSTSRLSLTGLRSKAARSFVEQHYAAWKKASGSTSHDLFLTEGAIACMKKFAPDVLAVCFGEIDCAHYGSWSRYVEAIQHTDTLTWRLWQTVQTLEAYRGRTLMLVLPDHGRELEESGGLGFVHHSDFYKGSGVDEGCRRVWMVTVGPGVPAQRTVEEPLPITSVAATALEFLGLKTSPGAAPSVWGKIKDLPASQ